MTPERFLLYISSSDVRDIALDTERPIRLLLAELHSKCQLPDIPEEYALFYGLERRQLSGEQTLHQARCKPRTPLAIANCDRPWWDSPAILSVPHSAERNPFLLLLFALGTLIVLLLSLPFLQNRLDYAGPSVANGGLQAALATSTLAPSPAPRMFTPGAPPAGGATAVVTSPAATSSSIATPPPPRRVAIRGVNQRYVPIDERLFARNPFGAFLWFDSGLSLKIPASEGVLVLSNGDEVHILEEKDNLYRVRVSSNQIDSSDQSVIGAEGWLPRWLVDDVGVPPLPATATAAPAALPTPAPRLRFRLLNYSDEATCISVQIRGARTRGWRFTIDGIGGITGSFDDAGNARICGVGANQEVTLSVLNARGVVVLGGSGIPAKGSAILRADWS